MKVTQEQYLAECGSVPLFILKQHKPPMPKKKAEYRKTCGLCHKRGGTMFARIFYKMINNEWLWLCKECWDKNSPQKEN